MLASSAQVREQKHSSRTIPNAVLGTIFLVVTEVMFFTGLLSAYIIVRATNFNWSIPINVKLPIFATGINTGILITSGVLLFLSGTQVQKNKSRAELLLWLSLILGCIFVSVQGYEWIQLINFGFTINSGLFAACFFLIVGIHAIHALAGVLAMFFVTVTQKGKPTLSALIALQVFWWFVVIMWPILYYIIYF